MKDSRKQDPHCVCNGTVFPRMEEESGDADAKKRAEQGRLKIGTWGPLENEELRIKNEVNKKNVQ